ncbi:hypothetical protein PCASD_23699 [Puccinia coronata f. sp. avenae]|uniref:Uncharacterized protein n=1 Tax=Puccinia coronata f. sp. avenae TaxID=200324 RepID=A0A2N5U716_9BASI|nr:hypothetical protein PCASD_23699 [Puccinia coronata f. sp. avenae]
MKNLLDGLDLMGDEDRKTSGQIIPSAINPARALNVDVLNSRLAQVEERKEVFNHLYQEALLTEKAGRGISFNWMMLLLAHYKLIEDKQDMQLQELLDQEARKQKIEELVKFEKIQGILKMVVERRRFRKTLQLFLGANSLPVDPNVTVTVSSARRLLTVNRKLGYY